VWKHPVYVPLTNDESICIKQCKKLHHFVNEKCKRLLSCNPSETEHTTYQEAICSGNCVKGRQLASCFEENKAETRLAESGIYQRIPKTYSLCSHIINTNMTLRSKPRPSCTSECQFTSSGESGCMYSYLTIEDVNWGAEHSCSVEVNNEETVGDEKCLDSCEVFKDDSNSIKWHGPTGYDICLILDYFYGQEVNDDNWFYAYHFNL